MRALVALARLFCGAFSYECYFALSLSPGCCLEDDEMAVGDEIVGLTRLT